MSEYSSQKKTDDQSSLLATSPPAKPESSEVAQATLTPVQKINTQVIKYATALWDKERATEFATRVALISRDNQKLRQAIEKNPDSFLSAFMASVTLNLMPNTPEADAYIIPYGDQVQFQTGYKGLLKLARRSGEIKSISAELVFGGDEFDVEYGTERKIIHKPSFDVDRTKYDKVTHAYATAILTNGEKVFAVMTKNELDKIQRSAKAQSTDAPWKTWPERMALKTVLKRLTQLLPAGTDDTLQKAATMDSLAEAGKLKLDTEGNIIEGELHALPEDVIEAIEGAETKEDLQVILDNLSVPERKKAAPLVAERMRAL